MLSFSSCELFPSSYKTQWKNIISFIKIRNKLTNSTYFRTWIIVTNSCNSFWWSPNWFVILKTFKISLYYNDQFTYINIIFHLTYKVSAAILCEVRYICSENYFSIANKNRRTRYGFHDRTLIFIVFCARFSSNRFNQPATGGAIKPVVWFWLDPVLAYGVLATHRERATVFLLK